MILLVLTILIKAGANSGRLNFFRSLLTGSRRIITAFFVSLVARFSHASIKDSCAEVQALTNEEGNRPISPGTTTKSVTDIAPCDGPSQSKTDLHPSRTEIHEPLAAREREEALLEQKKDSKNTTKAETHHTGRSSHVEKPVIGIGIRLAPDFAVTLGKLGAPRSNFATKAELQHFAGQHNVQVGGQCTTHASQSEKLGHKSNEIAHGVRLEVLEYAQVGCSEDDPWIESRDTAHLQRPPAHFLVTLHYILVYHLQRPTSHRSTTDKTLPLLTFYWSRIYRLSVCQETSSFHTTFFVYNRQHNVESLTVNKLYCIHVEVIDCTRIIK